MNNQDKDQDLRTIIHAIGEDVPAVDAAGIRQDAPPDEEPEPLLPPARNHWLGRLIATALLVWMGVVWSEAVVWGWSLSVWAGAALLVIGSGIVIGFLILAWQAHRARRRIDEIAQIQAFFKQAIANPYNMMHTHGSLNEWLRRIKHLYRNSSRRDELQTGLADVDESWSPRELADHLSRWYAAQDKQAALLIKRESTRTGVFIAASPYPALDLLLVAWRNAAMVERVAAIYGLNLSVTARWRLYQMILRNIPNRLRTGADGFELRPRIFNHLGHRLLHPFSRLRGQFDFAELLLDELQHLFGRFRHSSRGAQYLAVSIKHLLIGLLDLACRVDDVTDDAIEIIHETVDPAAHVACLVIGEILRIEALSQVTTTLGNRADDLGHLIDFP